MKTINIILSTYNSEKYLKSYFEALLEQTIIDRIQISIILNDPTAEELKIVESYYSALDIVYTNVKRESLYKSWNRAIVQSTCPYLVCWNVDDRRSANSLELMSRLLDENPEVGWTYTDFLIVNKCGDTNGKRVILPEWNQHIATHGAIGGPFFMWRRSLIKEVGYFDEQFRSGGDFDYTVRLSFATTGKKTKGCIDFFTNEGTGLSTNSSNDQEIERTVIQLRYSIYKSLDIFYLIDALNYKLHEITVSGVPVKIDTLIKNYRNIIDERKFTVVFMVLFFWRNSFKTIVKLILKKCGLM